MIQSKRQFDGDEVGTRRDVHSLLARSLMVRSLRVAACNAVRNGVWSAGRGGGRRRPGLRRATARGYALVHILGLIPLLAVITTLMLRGTSSIIRSQRAAVVRTNEFAVMNVWLSTLRNDTRRAAAMMLSTGANGGAGTTIELISPRGRITHRMLSGQVVRTMWEAGSPAATRSWTLRSMAVEVTSSGCPSGDLLQVTVEWKRVSRRRLEEPIRRFETSFLVGRSYAW